MIVKTIDLGYRPRKWQRIIHENHKRFGVLIVHRRAGKTIVGILQLINAALKTDRKAARYAYCEPQLNQAKAIAWTYLKEYGLKVPGTKVNETELWVEFANGARIRLYGVDHKESMRGQYFDGIVLDEYKDMPSGLWGEIILPALLDREGWCLFTGTPKGINPLSELYDRKQHDPEWFCTKMTCYDTGALSDKQIADAKKEMTPLEFQQEMLCDNSGGTVDTLISFTDVYEARHREPPKDLTPFAKVLGVDVARQGDDSSVIMKRQGPYVMKPVVLKGAHTMEVARAVAYVITEWEPDAVFVDGTGGYGAGVIDVLREMGYHPIEIQFSGKANDPRFKNKRAEMWWEMADWVKKPTTVLPDDNDLAAELAAARYEIPERGILMMEPKDNMKKRIQRSPDRADALALCFAMPIQAKNIYRLDTVKAESEYDPYTPERLGMV